MRCCPTAPHCECCALLCLSKTERQIRATADLLFDTVNTEQCCGCRDDALSKTETMLLLSVLSDQQRHTLRVHAPLINMIVAELRTKAATGSEAGSDITRHELRQAVMNATSSYQLQAVEAIVGELEREYSALSSTAAAEPLTMDREVQSRRGRNAPLLRR